MRVGFDTTPLERPHPPGVVRAARESLAALEARGRIEVVRLPPPAGSGTAGLRRWRRTELALASKREGLVGVHSFLSAFPWRGPGRRVQTVHELPWRHGVAENAGWAHRLAARVGPHFADAVLVPSEFVARDLGLRPAAQGGKLFVVPWGVGAPFAPDPAPGEVDEVVLGQLRLPESPLLLCPGAVRAKKNLAATLRGVARLRERGGPALHVVVSGEHSADLRSDLGLAQKLGLARFVSTPGHLPEESLAALLRLASAACVLSHSEGFGLPALEALACGTPVIVSRDSAQAEVAGDAGIAVDASDPDSVADGLALALEEREERRWSAPERAAAFSWERTAECIEGVWEGLVD